MKGDAMASWQSGAELHPFLREALQRLLQTSALPKDASSSPVSHSEAPAESCFAKTAPPVGFAGWPSETLLAASATGTLPCPRRRNAQKQSPAGLCFPSTTPLLPDGGGLRLRGVVSSPSFLSSCSRRCD